MQAPIGICTYIIRTETFDQAIQAAHKRGLKIYQWEWFPSDDGQEHWYIYEKEVKRQNNRNYLRGKGQLHDHGND